MGWENRELKMKELKRVIRTLILEELGDKVFAPFAPVGHPHHAEEPNTEAEDIFMTELWEYIKYNDSSNMEDDFGERFVKYSRNPKYSDVLKVVPDGIELYRGMLVPKELLELRIFGYDPTDEFPANSVRPERTYKRLVDSQYEHYDWRPSADQPLSSWTSDVTTAVTFSTGDETEQVPDGEIPVVFVASTGGLNSGRFLDFRQLYDYKGLEPKRHEQEIAGWGLLELDKIYVGEF